MEEVDAKLAVFTVVCFEFPSGRYVLNEEVTFDGFHIERGRRCDESSGSCASRDVPGFGIERGVQDVAVEK